MCLINYNQWSAKPMSKYEEFQEWLNQCPIKITNYEDNTTEFAIDFSMEVEIDEDAEEVEQCIVETNGDYSECVDRMVETMTEYDKWGNIKR
tara:strand:- start:712 stop:987 length:276 start_codon:yes stop_codon:yes gene_type:complete